jgi:hypothetical protein
MWSVQQSQGIGEPGTCAPSVQAVDLHRYPLKAPWPNWDLPLVGTSYGSLQIQFYEDSQTGHHRRRDSCKSSRLCCRACWQTRTVEHERFGEIEHRRGRNASASDAEGPDSKPNNARRHLL